MLDRLDELLQDTDPSIFRPVSIPLVKGTDETTADKVWPPAAQNSGTVYYFVEVGRDDGVPRDFISRDSALRAELIKLELLTYCGGGLAVEAGSRRTAAQLLLTNTWAEVKSALEWPGNWDGNNTGWVNATRIAKGDIKQRKAVLRLPCTFIASFDKEY